MPLATASAFRQAMLQKRPEIIEHLASLSPESLPFELGEGSQALRDELDASIDVWLDAAEGPGHASLTAWIDGLTAMARDKGLSGSQVLMLIERTGNRLLEASLDAVDEGVEGASNGTKGLIRAMNAATAAFDQAFRTAAEAEARHASVLRSVAENAPDGIGIADAVGTVLYTNRSFHEMMRAPAQEGGNLSDFVHPDDRPKLASMTESSRRTGRWEGTLRYLRADETTFNARVTAFRVVSDDGEVLAQCAVVRDWTDEERAAEERRALEEEMQRAQAAALRELSAPLLPLAEGVLAMPLVGSLDTVRTSRIIEVMLEGITRMSAGHVIIDITGVPLVDAEVAESIARAARAAALVGAEVVLTGVRGAVAKMLLELDVDLGGVDTWSTLRAGVAHAIVHERQKQRRLRAHGAT